MRTPAAHLLRVVCLSRAAPRSLVINLQFFLFTFVVLCGCLGMGAWLRLVAFSAKNPETAAALGMPIAVVQCIFGGEWRSRFARHDMCCNPPAATDA